MESVNRKLIRPSLNEIKEQRDRRSHQKKSAPPDQTNAENFYYMKQMQAKTPMVFVLKDGETLEGIIEWYDKTCLKINREGAPNLQQQAQYQGRARPQGLVPSEPARQQALMNARASPAATCAASRSSTLRWSSSPPRATAAPGWRRWLIGSG